MPSIGVVCFVAETGKWEPKAMQETETWSRSMFFVQDCLVIFAGHPWDFHLEICHRTALGFSKCMLDYLGIYTLNCLGNFSFL